MVTSKSEQWLKIKCHPGSTKTTFPAREGVMDTLQSSTTNYRASTFSPPLLHYLTFLSHSIAIEKVTSNTRTLPAGGSCISKRATPQCTLMTGTPTFMI